MKVKIKKVYYCDFCKKHSLRQDSLEKHEKHCTMNPNRTCRLCKNRYLVNLPTLLKKYANRCRRILDKFRAESYEWTGEPVTLKAIMEDTEGCPNCTLTILRLNGDLGSAIKEKFDYKAKLKDWWEMKNAEAQQEEMDNLRREICA